MIKKEIIWVGIVAVVLFVGWSLYDNQQYFRVLDIKPAEATTATATLNASVAAGAVTLQITSGGTVDFGTITAGTPKYSSTDFYVSANDTVNVSFGRKRSNPATTLASSANPSSYNISDTAGGVDVFTGCSSPVTAVWVSGSSTGLGFSLYKASENKNTTCWGTGTSKTDSANKYAALQASSSASTAWTTVSIATNVYASVGWVLDVPTSQAATSYTGDVIINATATP